MKFYKRDPNAAMAGMVGLTLQERGAYNSIIDLLYAQDGLVADDDEALRRSLGCHGNEWRAVKAKLVAKGKVWIEGGYLKAKRVDSVLKEAGNFSETQRIRAGKRWEIEGKRSVNPKKDEQKQQSVDARSAMPSTPTPTPTPTPTNQEAAPPPVAEKQEAPKEVLEKPATDFSWVVKVKDALGWDPSAQEPSKAIKFLASWAPLKAQGVDLELDLIPVIEERRAKNIDSVREARSLKYFEREALERKEARLALAQIAAAEKVEMDARVSAFADEQWYEMLAKFLQNGFWNTLICPSPCQANCPAPPEMLARAQVAWDRQGQHPREDFFDKWEPWRPDIWGGPMAKAAPFWTSNVIPMTPKAAQSA